MIERERRVNNFIFPRIVQPFLSDKKMDTVDSQILKGGPPQKLIDPCIYVQIMDHAKEIMNHIT
jgi:hypothetical protein